MPQAAIFQGLLGTVLNSNLASQIISRSLYQILPMDVAYLIAPIISNFTLSELKDLAETIKPAVALTVDDAKNFIANNFGKQNNNLEDEQSEPETPAEEEPDANQEDPNEGWQDDTAKEQANRGWQDDKQSEPETPAEEEPDANPDQASEDGDPNKEGDKKPEEGDKKNKEEQENPEGDESENQPNKPSGPASMWGDKKWQQMNDSLADQEKKEKENKDENNDEKKPGSEGNEEDPKKKDDEKGSLTQNVNKLRHRRKIKGIDKEIKKLEKQAKALGLQKKRLQALLIPLEIADKSLLASIILLSVVKYTIYSFALLSALTIILFLLGVTGIIWGIGALMNLPINGLELAQKPIKIKIKEIKKQLKTINDDIKKINRKIQTLSSRRRGLINQSLLKRNNQNNPENN